jgi:hypothetical protein
MYAASSHVDWIVSERSYPGQPRFTNITTLLKVHSRAEHADHSTFDTRYFICSAPLDIERMARGARGHWGVESMHWLLDAMEASKPVESAPSWSPDFLLEILQLK